MKNLLLGVLSEAQDFEDFRQKLIAALKDAIKKDAELKMAADLIRDEVIKGPRNALNLKASREKTSHDAALIEKAEGMLGRKLLAREHDVIADYGEAALKAMLR